MDAVPGWFLAAYERGIALGWQLKDLSMGIWPWTDGFDFDAEAKRNETAAKRYWAEQPKLTRGHEPAADHYDEAFLRGVVTTVIENHPPDCVFEPDVIDAVVARAVQFKGGREALTSFLHREISSRELYCPHEGIDRRTCPEAEGLAGLA